MESSDRSGERGGENLDVWRWELLLPSNNRAGCGPGTMSARVPCNFAWLGCSFVGDELQNHEHERDAVCMHLRLTANSLRASMEQGSGVPAASKVCATRTGRGVHRTSSPLCCSCATRSYAATRCQTEGVIVRVSHATLQPLIVRDCVENSKKPVLSRPVVDWGAGHVNAVVSRCRRVPSRGWCG